MINELVSVMYELVFLIAPSSVVQRLDKTINWINYYYLAQGGGGWYLGQVLLDMHHWQLRTPIIVNFWSILWPNIVAILITFG